MGSAWPWVPGCHPHNGAADIHPGTGCEMIGEPPSTPTPTQTQASPSNPNPWSMPGIQPHAFPTSPPSRLGRAHGTLPPDHLGQVTARCPLPLPASLGGAVLRLQRRHSSQCMNVTQHCQSQAQPHARCPSDKHRRPQEEVDAHPALGVTLVPGHREGRRRRPPSWATRWPGAGEEATWAHR